MAASVFQVRLARVLDEMAAKGGGVAVLFTAPERARNRDSDYPYRFDSHFWYLTGFGEPGAALALVSAGERRESILFCRPRDAELEIWDGVRAGPEGALAEYGFDVAHPIETIDAVMPTLLEDAAALYWPFASGSELDSRMRRWIDAVRAKSRSGVRPPAALVDLTAIVDEMRLVKDQAEVATMRRAAHISADAHRRVMKACRSGMREYQLEAELLHEFRQQGAQAPAYTSIVAAGPNACVLHYPAGSAMLEDGKLCLVDAGCEVDGYASDLTRTFPVSGRFSAEQRAVYDVVLAAQVAALEAVAPDQPFNAPHDAATRVLTLGLIDLGLLTGSLDGALENATYRQFFMHRTGHWLGLDVHDVGDYREPAGETGERPWRRLRPGMVLTVEPGLYLRPAPNVPTRFEHIGVRIEDDVLVTANGCEVLTQGAPKLAADIEALMTD